MVFFNGSMKIKVCEAQNLRPTDCATRLQMGGNKNLQLIDPYIAVDIDDIHVARTTTKPKTFKPVWNEEFTSEIHNGQAIGLTVFHDVALAPDQFVANCTVVFEELGTKESQDIWVRIIHFIWGILGM